MAERTLSIQVDSCMGRVHVQREVANDHDVMDEVIFVEFVIVGLIVGMMGNEFYWTSGIPIAMRYLPGEIPTLQVCLLFDCVVGVLDFILPK